MEGTFAATGSSFVPHRGRGCSTFLLQQGSHIDFRFVKEVKLFTEVPLLYSDS